MPFRNITSRSKSFRDLLFILKAKQKVGIFGKLVKLDSPLKDGDRIEIYCPITTDPRTVRRRRTGSDDDDE